VANRTNRAKPTEIPGATVTGPAEVVVGEAGPEAVKTPDKPVEEPKASDPKKQVAPPESIALKLIAILAEVGNVQKLGHNKAQDYHFARESDLVDKVRPIMAREHLFLHQTVARVEILDAGETRNGSKNRLVMVEMLFTWINADTGEAWQHPASFPGHGMDTGDKGVYKAMTGAEKYFLMKTFLVSTGDDPEGDERVDRQEAAAEAEAGTRVARRTRSEGQQKGGKSTVPTSAQIRELWRLFSAAEMDGATAVAYIERTLKISGKHIDLEAKGAMLNWVQSLTGAQVGILIRTLSETTGDTGGDADSAESSDSAETPGGDDGGSTDQPGDDAAPEPIGDDGLSV
jgi:hypothetical protein